MTKQIEDKVGTLEGVKSMSSTSSENRAMIMLEYDYGTDMDDAYNDLSQSLDGLSRNLPDDTETAVMEMNSNASSTMTLSISNPSREDLYDYVDQTVVPELEQISSVAEVEATGGTQASKEEAKMLLDEIDNLWNGPYLYQLSPLILLDFLVEHIRYGALRGIYEVVRKNYHIGRSIRLLVNREKVPASTAIYNQSMKAAGLLFEGDLKGFVRTAAAMFQNTHRLVVSECRRLGYFEPAMKVYDGEALWK